MKRLFAVLLLILLLAGCGKKSYAPEEPTIQPSAAGQESTQPVTEPAPTLPPGTYDPDSQLEAETYGGIKVYPLEMNHVRDVKYIQESVLVLSGDENSTTFTQLSGDTLYIGKSYTVDTYLYEGDIRFHQSSISFYHPEQRQTMVLSLPLQHLKSIDVPEDLVGTPILSQDQSTLFYCTADSVRALDLDSGISRLMKEISGDELTIDGTYLEDSIVKVQLVDPYGRWRSFYLSSEDGRIVWEDNGELLLYTSENRYFANYYEGTLPLHLYGTNGTDTRQLTPLHPEASCFYMPQAQGVVTAAYTGRDQVLDYYDLSSGLRTSTISFSEDNYIYSITQGENGTVYFLRYEDYYGCNVLYRWDPVMTLTGDDTVYTTTYATAENPDYAGLEECRAYAQALSEKHGVEILIYKDATAIEPSDYRLEPEHNVTVIRRELDLLDKYLGNYPEGFLKTLSDHFDGIRICIVKSLKGSAETGSLEEAAGIQFWSGYIAHVALAAHTNTEYALYHELCHLIDSVVLTESTAYDRWDTLNPQDFTYDYDYIVNIHRDGNAWLQPGNQSFIDTYSMSYPKEDRARIMEYAMTADNDSYFESRAMQKKLMTLCQGIRDAFGLKKSSDTFLWEQYLTTSLAWTE